MLLNSDTIVLAFDSLTLTNLASLQDSGIQSPPSLIPVVYAVSS